MARIVFRLKDVPEQEADAVRELLTDKDIEFYETDEGRWRISVGAIWVVDNDDYEAARELISDFQEQHHKEMRSQFEKDEREGKVISFWQMLGQYPMQVLAYLVLILIVLAVTILPMIHFFI